MLSSGEPSRRRDTEGNKNALEANWVAMSLGEAGKINVGHQSSAGSTFLPRRIAGSRLLDTSELRRTLTADVPVEQAFESVDVVAMPTSPIPPFRLGEKTADPLQMYLGDVFTVSVNLAGLPGISIPCGFADGLQIGFQLIGRMFDEATILRTADAFERATEWHKATPSMVAAPPLSSGA